MKILNLKKHKFWLIALGITILLILSRVLFLGSRVMHHDEGMLAFFAEKIINERYYEYTPQIHGPVLFYISSIFLKIFGSNDFGARFSCAFIGILLGVIPFLFRKDIGKKNALFLSFFVLISPSLTYYSRFLVHTAITIFFTYLSVIYLYLFLKRFKSLDLFLFAIFLSIAFGVSETNYIFVAVLTSFLIPLAIFKWNQLVKKFGSLKKFLRKNPYDLLSAITMFALVWVLIYSVGLTDAKSLATSLPNPFSENTALGFWLAQHDKRLGNQPWYFYILLMLLYEPMIVISYFAGIFDLIRTRIRDSFYFFLFWWATLTMVGFSWAGEKFPWLFLPTLIAFTVFSAYYFSRNFQKMHILVKLLWVLLFLFTIFSNIRLNFFNSADSRELNVYVQTPASFAETKLEIGDACEGEQGTDCVLIKPSITWPLAWDFRKYGRLDNLDANQIPAKTKFIFSDSELMLDRKIWQKSKIKLREWWVPQQCLEINCIPKQIKYFLDRKNYNDKGYLEVDLYRRTQ